MNIYRISQNSNVDYDTYDSAIVVAADEEAAKDMHPSGIKEWRFSRSKLTRDDWVDSPELVKVDLVGVADPKLQRCVVCASFNAG